MGGDSAYQRGQCSVMICLLNLMTFCVLRNSGGGGVARSGTTAANSACQKAQTHCVWHSGLCVVWFETHNDTVTRD